MYKAIGVGWEGHSPACNEGFGRAVRHSGLSLSGRGGSEKPSPKSACLCETSAAILESIALDKQGWGIS